MQVKTIIAGVLVGFTAIIGFAIADSSTNYNVDVSTLNSSGDNASASTSYELHDTFTGPFSGETASSLSYLLQAGLIHLESYCGNSMTEVTEECDDGRNCTDGTACTLHATCAGIGDNLCLPRSGDGCDDTCQSEGGVVCGNGVKEGAEECDTNDFGIMTCASFGYVGSLTCNACAISTLSCTAAPVIGGGGGGGGGPSPTPTPTPDDDDDDDDDTRRLSIIAHPEKRIPATGNWSTTGKLTLYSTEDKSEVFTANVTLDDNGKGSVGADELEDGTYHAAFKGRSHLVKILRDITVKSDATVLDYTNEGKEFLLAGDVQSGKDNLVNALDLSAIVIAIYSDDLDADLNLDGIVNALDLSMTAVNIYKSGETP